MSYGETVLVVVCLAFLVAIGITTLALHLLFRLGDAIRDRRAQRSVDHHPAGHRPARRLGAVSWGSE